MGFLDEYLKLRQQQQQEKRYSLVTPKKGNSFADTYLSLREQRMANDNNRQQTYASTAEPDIAPSKSTVTEDEDEGKKWYEGWFQKGGAFEDGYQFGDIWKTIEGTSRDLEENVMAGILGIGEGIVDTGAYILGAVGGRASKDFKDKTQEFIAKDLYDEKAVAQKILGMQPQLHNLWTKSENSVLGEKSDSLAQSGGQLLGTAALQAAGVPWWVTTGATTFGSAADEAFNAGADYGEAGLSAAITAGAEILTEKMFGGSGLGEKGLINLDKLTAGIANKTAKALLDFGIDMAAEGSEEVFSQVISNLGSALYREESLMDILASEEAVNEYIESFIGGSVLGGGANVGKVVTSVKNGRDYRNGLNADEQKVFDHEYDSRVKEAEDGGEKLTNKDKNALYDQVMEDMRKGYISTDTIESVLGGESYKAYKDATDEQDALQSEYDSLADIKKSNLTTRQEARLSEITQKLDEFKQNNTRDTLKAKLSDEVMGLTRGGILAESYNQKAQRGAAFEADVSKYDTKQQAVVQKAIDSGILNNTRRTHEFVDMVAKISADKGVLFDFANNEKLKASGFAVDGATVNGYVTKDGVTVNIDSAKSLNSVVGHEITHVLEGTEIYTELQSVIAEYAKTKGEYDSRRASLAKLYEGVKDANIDAELTADLVGDYLFTDSEFINSLSTKNRNVFQKIYDEIKYLVKVATAGSKEARELEKVKRAFDKAYKESGKVSSDIKYSVTEYTAEEKQAHNKAVVDHFGKTYKWAETGYLLLDGTRLDLSGKHDGAPGGYRTVDHRDITEALGYDYGGGEYSDSLIQFMSEGNIRIIPEMDGINLSVKPTKAQEQALSDFISRARGEVVLDIDGLDGYTEVSVEYPRGTHANKVLNDIREWFDNGKKPAVSNTSQFRYSLSRNAELMQNAEDVNSKNLGIDLNAARQQRQEIYDYMTRNAARLKLPEDIEGNTAIKNSSYDITEENTTVCIRSMAADALCDAVAEELGRPLTVQDTLRISQDLMNYTDEPECVYCYVATDRKAYREFLGSYYKQMQETVDAIRSGKNADEVYKTFLDGRKDTKNMRNRFAMWEQIANGGKMISAKDLASEKMMQNAMRDPELAAQVKDARAYAQSASWAKKRMGYQAYDGHILNWSQRRINDLNKHYGLRFYSFSDFSPAFVLENMQQITDASVRGLKGLAYTKVLDFAEIFAPTGININISVFGYDQNGVVAQDGMMGADWKGAQDLRSRYENVGITFVATNDSQIEWALDQDWIDVVIPYHLVRTGQAVAKAFGYTNYTAESGDTKGANWKKGDKKTIYPSEHNNDKQTYLAAIAEANLEPRFARWVNHPNYMKLVNETRRSAKDTPQMQATFNVEAAKGSLDRMMKRGGYFVPIGGDYANMQEIAGEIAGDIRGGKAYSLTAGGKRGKVYGDYNVYGEDVRLDVAPVQDGVQVENVRQNAQTETAPVLPDDPFAEMDAGAESERLYSLDDADAPPEMEAAPAVDETVDNSVDDPFADRDISEVGNRKVNAYMYENPEVKPYFQAEANVLLGELRDGTKGERFYTETPDGQAGVYGAESYGVWTGVKRNVSPDIEYLLDGAGMSYADIEKGLRAIIEDHGAENIAAAKKIEFVINDRLMKGYQDWQFGSEIPPNQDYINIIEGKQFAEQSAEAFDSLMEYADMFAPPVEEEAAPVKAVKQTSESIKPQPQTSSEPRMKRIKDGEASSSDKPERRWVGTSTESKAVDGIVTPDDIPDDVRYYQVKTNKKTLEAANARLARDGYAKSREYFEGRMSERKLSVEDIALGERLIQEAAKAGDAKAVRDLIIDVSILGTELGQRVQALSLINRLTPEGQLKALHRTVERGKAKGDKAFDGVEVTEDMNKRITDVYNEDGTFDQAELNAAVEDVKQQIADQMGVGALDYINAWRYLSMLGNPKTHIRNVVSNVAMMGTRAVKNAVARTIEDIAPIKTRTKTWKGSTGAVKTFAEITTAEMDAAIKGDTKYNDESGIKAKRKIFKTGVGNALANANTGAMEFEDAIFSKRAFRQTFAEYLTANGIKTKADITNNPQIVEKAKDYALEESRRATFRQDSYFANKIAEIERKNPFYGVAIGSVLPFKKTPINIAKTGVAYSPLGFARNIYDAVQVKKGNMDASEAIDHLAQTLTGTSLTLIGFALANAGILNGAGDDDKEGKYDYQLGEQSYSFNLGGNSYSLSWLTPVAMPLLVGANAYEKLVEKSEWDMNVVVDTLAQTLDPLSEMSFLSSLDDVLSSYDSGIDRIWGAGESMVQNYATQFIPTLSSQIAATFDDVKRSTKPSANSGFDFGEETLNKIKYKIPGLRNTLEPTTDIWGNEYEQSESWAARAFENFLSPANKRTGISTAVDSELKDVYRETGDASVLPSIPYNYINYNGTKYEMSAKEHTAYKQAYGQTAKDLMEQLFDTGTYRAATSEERADMISRVYDYARDEARREYFAGLDVDYTNAESDGEEVYKENPIKGAIEADLPVDEYIFSKDYPAKYNFFKQNGISYDTYKAADEDGKRAYTWAYENPGKYTMSKEISNDFLEYYGYKDAMNDFDAKDANGETVSGLKKDRVAEYINGLDNLDYGQKIILFRSMYDSKSDRAAYNQDILDYLNSRQDISYEDTVTILKELGFTVDGNGNVYWD
jgi:hypothetical protein